MRIALDTNILVYAEGIMDDVKQKATFELIREIPVNQIVIPIQCLGELCRVLTSKSKRTHNSIQEAIFKWSDTYETADTTWAAFQSAMHVVAKHQLQIWDALILSVAAEQQCRYLLSEDMQHGFVWNGVTIVNPYQSAQQFMLNILHHEEFEV